MIDRNQLGQINLHLLLTIFLGIGMVLFGVLSVVAFNERNQTRATVNQQIASAVSKAKAAQKKDLDDQYAKANQSPYRKYVADKSDGSFEIQIPKNWSLYAEKSGTGQAQLTLLAGQDTVTVNKSGINTQPFKLQLLRTTALDVVKKYSDDIKKNKLINKTIKVSGIDATYLEGVLDNERHDGIMVIVPVRDKAMVFSTESKSFASEFSQILGQAKIIP